MNQTVALNRFDQTFSVKLVNKKDHAARKDAQPSRETLLAALSHRCLIGSCLVLGPERIKEWNQVAMNLGRPGFPMAERFSTVVATVYKDIDSRGITTVFEVLGADEKDDERITEANVDSPLSIWAVWAIQQ